MSINYQEFLDYLDEYKDKYFEAELRELALGNKEDVIAYQSRYSAFCHIKSELIRNHEAWLFAHKETLCACCDKPVGKDVVCYECYNHEH